MDIFTATMIAEMADGYETDDEAVLNEAWQTLIDTGAAWTLQGWFGRCAHHLIETGVCHAAGAKS